MTIGLQPFRVLCTDHKHKKRLRVQIFLYTKAFLLYLGLCRCSPNHFLRRFLFPVLR